MFCNIRFVNKKGTCKDADANIGRELKKDGDREHKILNLATVSF